MGNVGERIFTRCEGCQRSFSYENRAAQIVVTDTKTSQQHEYVVCMRRNVRESDADPQTYHTCEGTARLLISEHAARKIDQATILPLLKRGEANQDETATR